MKGLGPRSYNILFHTHTVSGIMISAVLFVIFFAGAISLYKKEIYQWENPAARIAVQPYINYEKLFDRLDSLEPRIKDMKEVSVILPTEKAPVYTLHVPIEGLEYATFVYNPLTEEIVQSFRGDGTTTGETLYRLHFLDQVPWYIGRYIAGFVSLFFAFAVVTGLLIHWRNIVSKFYAFSFQQVKKQFWTNAHTVFGLIGLPFQLMYAITGAFYLLSLFILAPAVMVLFKGDQDELITRIYPPEAFHRHHDHEHEASEVAVEHMPIAMAAEHIRKDYAGYTMSYLEIVNLGQEDAVMATDLLSTDAFNQDGTVVLDLITGEYKLEIKPGDKNYAQSLLGGIGKLHFGSFGGWMLKTLYFVLSLFSCFVIVSGILMWKEARNKPNYTDSQRRFHHRVTMIYLSVCFSLFPATALLFLAEQVVSRTDGHADTVNTVFFVSWLLLAIVGYLCRNEKRLTAFCLILGGILACAIPLANGIYTGDWFWATAYRLPYVFMTDMVWLMTGVLALVLAYTSWWQKSLDN